MIKQMLLLGFIGLLIFSIFSGFIADFLRLDSVTLVLLTGIVFFISWVQPVNLGTMQGLQRFKHFSYNLIVQAGAKFIVGAGLVILGFGIFGAIWGLVLGFIVSLLVSFYLVRDIIRFRNKTTTIPGNPGYYGINDEPANDNADSIFQVKPIYEYSFFVFLAVACITIPTNIDILIVKHFFSSEETAHYTAAAIFGKMIFFLPIGITRVMYPKVVEGYAKKAITKGLLNRSLLYTGLPTGLLVLVLWMFPGFFLEIFFGSNYLVAKSLLQLYGPMMFFFSLTTVFVYYNLARNRYGFVCLFTAYTVLELILVWMYHSSIMLILQILLLMTVLFFVIGLISTHLYNEEKEVG